MSVYESVLGLTLIHEPDAKSIAAVVQVLGSKGISSALWGVNAGVCYGAGLCPLDIELVVNADDQAKAFDVLTSNGLLPSVPEGTAMPESFTQWETLLPSVRFRDRRRTRLPAPIYAIPPTGDPISNSLLPFLILYSAQTVGLPPVKVSPYPDNVVDSLPSTIEISYLPLASHPGFHDSKGLIPSFPRLVESEMHVLLQHAEFLSPVWGQHAAQLSELAHSGSCPGGLSGLAVLVKPELTGLAAWFRSSQEGRAKREDLVALKAAYLEDLGLK